MTVLPGRRAIVAAQSALHRENLTRHLENTQQVAVVAIAPSIKLLMHRVQRTPAELLVIEGALATPDSMLETFVRARNLPAILAGPCPQLHAPWASALLPEVSDERFYPNLLAALRVCLPLSQPPCGPLHHRRQPQVLAFGASAGGPDALERILSNLRRKRPTPPILITQHLRSNFRQTFATRLQQQTRYAVETASDGLALEPDTIYLAPAEHHLTVSRIGSALYCALSNAPARNGHRPSVDTMFESLAYTCGAQSIGVLLTGMGMDGATGMKTLALAGGFTVVQDRASSVVWSMPRAALELEAAQRVVALNEMASCLASLLSAPQAPAR